MNRILFMISYLIFAIFFSGLPAPKGYLIGLRLIILDKGINAFINPFFLLLLLGPSVLVVIGYFRGKAISKYWLVWFPVIASILAFAPPAIDIFVFSKIDSANGSFSYFWTFLSRSISFFGPIVFHISCLVLGFNQARSEVLANQTLHSDR